MILKYIFSIFKILKDTCKENSRDLIIHICFQKGFSPIVGELVLRGDVNVTAIPDFLTRAISPH